MALRTPTFANVQVLEVVLPGTRVDDVEATIASLGWTLGDLDK
ncbi:NADH-ubiquinone oxidoreductase [Cutibacterium acnes JCM 18909]|nr:NADH-ubiquinone oxidoreductase [Cutibacterium acnes JCM 18909]